MSLTQLCVNQKPIGTLNLKTKSKKSRDTRTATARRFHHIGIFSWNNIDSVGGGGLSRTSISNNNKKKGKLVTF